MLLNIVKLDCFFIGLWRSLITLSPVSGHDYVEYYKDKEKQVLKCNRCGNVSVGYFTKGVC